MRESDGDKTQVRPAATPAQKIPARYQASVVIIKGRPRGMEYAIDRDYAVIGRDNEAQIRLTDSLVSRQHAVIVFRDGNFQLRDLESTNGTQMNNVTIRQAELRHGDTFRVGDTVLQFVLEDTGRSSTYEIG